MITALYHFNPQLIKYNEMSPIRHNKTEFYEEIYGKLLIVTQYKGSCTGIVAYDSSDDK